jgi:hypothetical protein
MSDFLKAIQAGISGAESALIAANEIKSIIDEVGQDLLRATAGRVALNLEEDAFTSTVATAIAKIKSQVPTNVKSLRLLVKPVVAGQANKGTEIGTILTSPGGYPVVVSWANVTNSASDGPGFRKALADLFSTPDTGRAILAAKEFMPTAPRIPAISKQPKKRP